MNNFPDKISLSQLNNFNQQSQFRKDALAAVAVSPEETVNLLVNQVIALQEMVNQQLVSPKIDDAPVYKVEYPDHPIDTFYETLYQYFNSLEEQEQTVWNGLSAAQLTLEFADNSELAGEFVAELLNSLLSNPDWTEMKAEQYDPEKHSGLTDLALQINSVYMLIKTLKTQLDRVAMKDHIDSGWVSEVSLLNNRELQSLVKALAIKFGLFEET